MNGDSAQPFGAWVLALRKSNRLEQVDLAKLMKVDKTLVSKVENGSPPTTAFAVALADALGLDLIDTLQRAGKWTGQSGSSPDDDLGRIKRRLGRMSAARRNYWLSVFDALIEAGEKGDTYEPKKQ